MDILLIAPPHHILLGVPTDRGYNVGLTSLAAYIRNEGIETAVLMGDLLMDSPSSNILAHPVVSVVPDWLRFNVKKYAAGQKEYEMIVNDKSHVVWGKLTDIVRQTNPMAVGIQYLTPLKCVVERVAGLVKEVDRDIKVVVGSFHPTVCPDEVMQNPDIDFVIRGEGEIPLLRLIKELKKDSPKWETVPGIHYRNSDGQVQNNPCVNPINNLDELPFPARDLVLNIDYNRYRVHFISTARGCPYKCSFCADRRLWGGKVRRRSVGSVIEELRLLKDTYNVNTVEFVDGTFTFDRNYLQTFCKAMIDRKLNIKWRCTARYDNLDEELLQLMKQANCSGLYLGLESGSDRVLKGIGKKETVEKIIKASEMLYDSGITSVTSIMLGLPDESKEDIEETLRLMKEFKTDFFDVNSYLPLAGTPLYDSMSAEDKKNIDWGKVGYKSFDNYFSKNISRDDFKRYKSEAYKIANAIRKKSLIRLGVRIFSRSVAKMFKIF
jgi:anaerobic magnesium-protoporphyrin IX monomethyl ester cyclase